MIKLQKSQNKLLKSLSFFIWFYLFLLNGTLDCAGMILVFLSFCWKRVQPLENVKRWCYEYLTINGDSPTVNRYGHLGNFEHLCCSMDEPSNERDCSSILRYGWKDRFSHILFTIRCVPTLQRLCCSNPFSCDFQMNIYLNCLNYGRLWRSLGEWKVEWPRTVIVWSML